MRLGKAFRWFKNVLSRATITITFPFLFSNKMLVIRAGIHKMHVRIANREDPDQTSGLCCLPRPFSEGNKCLEF